MTSRRAGLLAIALVGALSIPGTAVATAQSFGSSGADTGVNAGYRNHGGYQDRSKGYSRPGRDSRPTTTRPAPTEPTTQAPAPAPAPAPVPGAQGPSGNSTMPAAAQNASFTASNGQSGQYHLINGHVDPAAPVGLIVQLHGDGAGEFQNYSNGRGKLTQIEEVAKQHNMVLLSARTPSFEEGDATWWVGDGKGKSDYLADLIESVAYEGHDIDRSQVFLAGYSGGAEQLTYNFLKNHLDMVEGGGALITGGGGSYGSINAPATLKQNFRLQWLTGSDDYAGSFCGHCAATKGEANYRAQGFQRTDVDLRSGIDHYELQNLEADALNKLIVG